jgi:membrane protein DedA with SNARE-associated domain
LTEQFVGQLGYVGIALALVLGGLGLPIPEEAPVILAAVLSKSDKLWWPYALAACITGVLLGDFLVYFLGFVYGEKVLNLPWARQFLTRAREAQIKGYFHRHGIKILILGRFAVGFRTAAYLTAGILRLPTLKLFLTDLFAASLSTFLMFGLGFVFAHQIEHSLDRIKWLIGFAALLLAGWLLYRFFKARQRAGLPVGPRVLDTDDLPLPPDDLHAYSGGFRTLPSRAAAPPPSPQPLPGQTSSTPTAAPGASQESSSAFEAVRATRGNGLDAILETTTDIQPGIDVAAPARGGGGAESRVDPLGTR